MKTPKNNIDLGSFNADESILNRVDTLYSQIYLTDIAFYQTAFQTLSEPGRVESFVKLAIPRIAKTAADQDLKLPTLYLYRQMALYIAGNFTILFGNVSRLSTTDPDTQHIPRVKENVRLGAPVTQDPNYHIPTSADGSFFKDIFNTTEGAGSAALMAANAALPVFNPSAFSEKMKSSKPADRSKPVLTRAVIRGFERIAYSEGTVKPHNRRDELTALKYMKRIVEWNAKKGEK